MLSAKSGKRGSASYQQPSLGCREFAARFEPATEREEPEAVNEDLGRMLYDLVFREEGNRPLFFPAQLTNGVMDTFGLRLSLRHSRGKTF